jgi:parallel beta-helix repeat protein
VTYTFKLSQRLARLRDVAGIIACSLALSCTADGLSGPESPASADPTTVAISPDSSVLGVGQTMQFQAATTSRESSTMVSGQRRGQYKKMVRLSVSPVSSIVVADGAETFQALALLSDGSSLVPPLTWSATGGTVDGSGRYRAWSTPGKFHVIATASNGLADTAVVTITLTAPVLAQILLSPANVSLSAGGSQQFFVEGKTADSISVGVTPIYTATGGSISPLGAYIAGSTPGTFQVIASDSASGLADTAVVTIAPPAPTLQAVALTPASVGLLYGASQQFAVSGLLSDGSTAPVSVTYSATGGTITPAGLYTAGVSSGSYRVIATAAGGTLADTAAVDVTAPASAPPEPPATPPGIPIIPGQSIQAAVNANPSGTIFLIKAGRHSRQSVLPKNGDIFRCEAGAILDGENVTPYAFTRSGGDPDDVRIVGCVIEHYAPAAQMGAILAGGHSASDLTDGWIVDSTEVRYNTNLGIRVGNRTKVRWSNVHHNGTLGIGGTGDDILIESTEIAYNNPSGAGLGFESGGTKFVLTNRLIARNNRVHDNKGPGLWADIGNRGFLFEDNLVEDQLQDGIVIEISYGGIIRNNTCRRNGLGDTRRFAWPWGAGIGIHASGGPGIEVYGNVLEGNAYGISLIQQARGTNHLDPAGVDPEMYVQNINAHDNTIKLATGSLGASQGVDDSGTSGLFSSGRNIVFTRNGYSQNGIAYPFAWANSYRTSAQWRGYGFDTDGSFAP